MEAIIAYRLSQRLLASLKGVHPALVRVVHHAIQITGVDFMVTEGAEARRNWSRPVPVKPRIVAT